MVDLKSAGVLCCYVLQSGLRQSSVVQSASGIEMTAAAARLVVLPQEGSPRVTTLLTFDHAPRPEPLNR